MRNFFDQFWHRTLCRPYRLARQVDIGRGVPVVLLHGIGSSSGIWRVVVERLAGSFCRVVAFDLLGFGQSPKPNWPAYNIDDHAHAVISAIQKLRARKPIVLVGHSMGCLVAVRVARLRPDLVRHLVLYEMPLYDGLPEKRTYSLRLKAYRALYNRILQLEPTFDGEKSSRKQRLAVRAVGLKVTKQTWEPFRRSLGNTIMHQTAVEDIRHIAAPMDVIYGRRDMLVIRGKTVKIFGQDTAERITAHTINASHAIPKSAAKFIVERIMAAIMQNSSDDT